MSLKGQTTRDAVGPVRSHTDRSGKGGVNSKQHGTKVMSNMSPNPLFVHPPVSECGDLKGGKVSKKS